jgi:hypothetical protein
MVVAAIASVCSVWVGLEKKAAVVFMSNGEKPLCLTSSSQYMYMLLLVTSTLFTKTACCCCWKKVHVITQCGAKQEVVVVGWSIVGSRGGGLSLRQTPFGEKVRGKRLC